MKNNQSLEIVESLYALARSFVCDPSRIIDTQDGFLIHSSSRTHLSFSNLLLFNIVFSHSLYTFLLAFLFTQFSCCQAHLLHFDIHI